jgi:hypothetical protein
MTRLRKKGKKEQEPWSPNEIKRSKLGRTIAPAKACMERALKATDAHLPPPFPATNPSPDQAITTLPVRANPAVPFVAEAVAMREPVVEATDSEWRETTHSNSPLCRLSGACQ